MPRKKTSSKTTTKEKYNKNESYGKKGKPKFRNKPSGVRKNEKNDEYTGVPANDPKYYQNNPILTALSAAIPINPVLGTKEIWHNGAVISGDIHPDFYWKGNTIPGMMGIALIPAFGSDMETDSAATASFNRLCANLYSVLVRDKSGTAPFDQAAIGQYLTAMRSAYIVVHDLKRFLSIVSYYQAGNRYFPKGVGYAMGRSNYSLTAAEMDAAIWKVNELVRLLNTKFVPKMSVFTRDFDLYSRFYADSDTEYAQYYCFFPRGYYKYDDQNNVCEFKGFGNTDPELPKSLSDIVTIVDDIIASIQNSDIFNIITSWMRHVYSPGESWQLEELGFNPQPVFVYDEYVLAQIENSRSVAVFYSNFNGLDLIQDGSNNYLEYRDLDTGLSNSADGALVLASADPVFNFHVTVPTEDMKLESSRLTVCAREEIWDTGTSSIIKAKASGFIFSDQVPVGYLMAVYDSVNDTWVTKRFWSSHMFYLGADYNSFLKDMLPEITMFKRHPLMWVGGAYLTGVGNPVTSAYVTPVGEIDTVGTLDKEAFNRLSYTCTYSLFSIPGITT